MRPSIDVLVPTYGRPEYHERLYRIFAAQQYDGELNLWVYDDSPKRSPFFTWLEDWRVHYLWVPARMSIGAKRNHLTHWSRGDVLAAFDDDDYYAPTYLQEMVDRLILTRADLVKLAVWDAVSAFDHSRWRWDTRVSGGTCYSVSGAAAPVKIVNCPLDEEARRAALLGYGFSYVYTRAAAERVPFEDINHGEDLAFIRRLGDVGGKIVLVDDHPDLVLHTLHAKSTSKSYPQTRLTGSDIGIEVEDAKGTGSKHFVKFNAGKTYRVIGLIKGNHTVAETKNRVEAFAEVLEYVDPYIGPDTGGPAPKGYRHVLVKAKMRTTKAFPRRIPPPFSIVDKSGFVKVSAA